MGKARKKRGSCQKIGQKLKPISVPYSITITLFTSLFCSEFIERKHIEQSQINPLISLPFIEKFRRNIVDTRNFGVNESNPLLHSAQSDQRETYEGYVFLLSCFSDSFDAPKECPTHWFCAWLGPKDQATLTRSIAADPQAQIILQ